jgi:uncharacterized Fe-S cluster-containing radical SAM superfamily protein
LFALIFQQLRLNLIILRRRGRRKLIIGQKKQFRVVRVVNIEEILTADHITARIIEIIAKKWIIAVKDDLLRRLRINLMIN